MMMSSLPAVPAVAVVLNVTGLPLSPPAVAVTEPPAGQQPPPIPIAASPDEVPTEVHVLLSQMSGRALLFTAGTPPRQWLVAGDRIAEIRDGAPRFVTSQD